MLKLLVKHKAKAEELNYRENEIIKIALMHFRKDLLRHKELSGNDADLIDVGHLMMKLRIL